MHGEWCGKHCGDCEHPCRLDEKIPCSPDCELLGEFGDPIDAEKCKEIGCDAYIWDDEEDEEEEDYDDDYTEPSDAEQACHLIDEITEIVDGLEIDKKIKVKIKDKLYEITTHLDM